MRSNVLSALFISSSLCGFASCADDAQEDTVAAALGNTPPPAPPATLGYPTDHVVQAATAGYLPGTGVVTETGEYEYTMPIDVPAGRAGMQPALSLRFHSRGENGYLGRGFELSGLSQIRSCRTGDFAGKADGYCLDGQPLVEVGSYYYTREDTFVRLSKDDDGWTAYEHDGRIRTYERAPAIAQYSVNADGVTEQTTYPPWATDDHPWVWRVKREEDRVGNAIDYTYIDATTTLLNMLDLYGQYTHYRWTYEYYPDEIIYTSRGSELGQRSVKFYYESADRPDPLRECAYGPVEQWMNDQPRCLQILNLRKRLYRIELIAPNPSTPAVAWSYDFSYEPSPTSGESLLTSVERCGALGGCLPARTFKWWSHESELVDWSTSIPYTQHQTAPIVMDVNGDGVDELISQVGPVVVMNTNSTYLPLQNQYAIGGLTNLRLSEATVVDVDGDGQQELVAPNPTLGRYMVARWSGTFPTGGSFVQTFLQTPSTYDAVNHDPIYFADVDGDGFADAMKGASGQPGGWEWSLRFNNGDGTFGANAAVVVSGDPVRAGDMGVPLVMQDTTRRSTVYVARSGSALVGYGALGFGWETSVLQLTPGSWWDDSGYNLKALGDVDEDGLVDSFVYYPLEGKLCVTWDEDTGDAYYGLEAPQTDGLVTTCTSLADSNASDTNIWNWRLQVVDFDGDGRQDAVLSHINQSPQAYVLRLDASNTWHQTPIGAGTTEALGDFNGDGYLDYAWWDGELHVETQQSGTGDDLIEIGDEGGPTASEKIDYWTHWYGTVPTATGPCTFPERCLRQGLSVVWQHWVYAGHDAHNPQWVGDPYLLHEYTYEDPRFDLRRRHFLGFSTVREWNSAQPSETITTYDLDTTDEGDYVLARLPSHIRVVTPIVAITGDLPLQTATAHASVVDTDINYEVKHTNSEATFFVTLHDWSTDEWQELVHIDWSQMARPHITGIDGPQPRPLRTRTGVVDHDGFGNVTYSRVATQGGVTTTTSAEYQNDTTNWLLGRPTYESVTSGDPTTTLPARRVDYTYDSLGYVATIALEKNTGVPSLAETTTLTRDADGQVIKYVRSTPNAPIRVSYVAYEPTERVYRSQEWDDLGHAYWYLYQPALGTLAAAMDSNGVQTHWQVDDLGRVVRVMPDGQVGRRVDYAARNDAAGRIGTVILDTGDDGSTTRVELDELGRVVLRDVTGFDGTTIHQATHYDLLGRLAWVGKPGTTSAPTAMTRYTFDSLDRPTAVQGPDGTTTTIAQTFSTTSETDPLGRVRVLERDLDDRVIGSTEYLGSSPLKTTYRYGPFDALVKITDSSNNVTQYAYDRRGRQVSTVEPDAGTSTYTYNGFGDVRTATLNGATTSYFYDAIGRLTSATDADGTTTLVWDTATHGNGKLRRVTGPTGVSEEYTYDSFSRPTRDAWTVDGVAYNFDTTYDATGRLSVLTYPQPGTAPAIGVRRNYNAYGYLSELRDVPTGVRYWRVDGRSPDGALAQGTYGNGLVEVRMYDGQTGRLDLLRVGPSEHPAYGRAYVYDDDGEIIERDDTAVTRSETFDHDTLGRVTSWVVQTGSTSRTTSYEYDTLGNPTRTKVNGTVVETNVYGIAGKPHQLSSNSQGAFAYDASGRQTTTPTRTVTFTAHSQPRTVATSAGTTTFAYDAFGTRVKKIAPDGTVTLTLGAFERRIAPGGAATDIYYIDGDEGGPVAQVTYTESSGTRAVSYLHRDPQGTLGAMTGPGGVVTARMFYEPFGRRAQIGGAPLGATVDPRLGFTARDHDDELGLIDMLGRAYDPQQHRFVTPDPHVTDPLDGQNLNPYSYVLNRPLELSDPSGFDWWDSGGGGCIGMECGGAGPVGFGIQISFGSGAATAPIPSGSGASTPAPGRHSYDPKRDQSTVSVPNGPLGTGSSPRGPSTAEIPWPPPKGTFLHDWYCGNGPCNGNLPAPEGFINDMHTLEVTSGGLFVAEMSVFAGSAGALEGAGGVIVSSVSAIRTAVGSGITQIGARATSLAHALRQAIARSAVVQRLIAGTAGCSGMDRCRETVTQTIGNVDTPKLTYAHGFVRGFDVARLGDLVLGKFPGNVDFVARNAGTFTLDRPWGWSAMYNAGFVRGVLEGGGRMIFTSTDFTGTFSLEMQQVTAAGGTFVFILPGQ